MTIEFSPKVDSKGRVTRRLLSFNGLAGVKQSDGQMPDNDMAGWAKVPGVREDQFSDALWNQRTFKARRFGCLVWIVCSVIPPALYILTHPEEVNRLIGR